jgi:methionyl-tRNA formyltransferase
MGETITGNTTMLLEEGLDTGPILLQRAVIIRPEQTAVQLYEELAAGGAPMVVETLEGLADGTIEPQPQDHSRATLAPLLDREDGRMDFSAFTATQLMNRWRGFQPWPGAFTALNGKKLIVHRTGLVETPPPDAHAAPGCGQLVIAGPRLLVACAANTWLELIELQLEGKKRLSAVEFLRGMPFAPGTPLG